MKVRRNPPLALVENPPHGGRVFGAAVFSVAYRHQEDGRAYQHDFEDAERVELIALPDGSLLLRHRDGRELWREFP